MARPRHIIHDEIVFDLEAGETPEFFDIDYASLEMRALLHYAAADAELSLRWHELYGGTTMRADTSIFTITDPQYPSLGDLKQGDFFRFSNGGQNVYIVQSVERDHSPSGPYIRVVYVQLANGRTWDTAKGTGTRDCTPRTRVTKLRAVDLKFEVAQ